MDQDGATEWAREEFGNADLGDRRRCERLVAMAAGAARRPAGRVTQVFAQAAARQGAYDFLESEHSSAREILATVADASRRRAMPEECVVIPIDGTSLSLADHAEKKGFGSVGSRERGARGIKIVDAIAVTAAGLPLGVLAMRWWSRPIVGPPARDRQLMTPDEKEVQHWLGAIDDVQKLLDEAPSTRGWLQLDREGDSQHVLEKLSTSRHWFTVRSNSDRRIHLRGPLRARPDRPDWGTRHYLRPHLRRQPILGRYRLDVPARDGRPARRAEMLVRLAAVQVLLRDRRTSKRRVVTVNAVWGQEFRGPRRTSRSGETRTPALDWLLLTNYPVTTLSAATHVISTYALRWRIEDFHRAWKSGVCNVEETQLRKTEHVMKWAAILAAVAMRAERLKHLARENPDASASDELSSLELEALLVLKKRQAKRGEKLTRSPSLATAVRWIAELGGYTGKSSGGPPGVLTISRGLEQLQIAEAVVAALAKRQRKR
jgi:hypothetical protein